MDFDEDDAPQPTLVNLAHQYARQRWMMPRFTRVASADILPSRFVVLDTANQEKILQASGTGTSFWGISQNEKRGRQVLAPVETRAVAAGETCFVFGPNAQDVLLTLGGTVNIGDRLTSDSTGRGIKSVNNGDWIGAVAQERGFLGQQIHVTVLPPKQSP